MRMTNTLSHSGRERIGYRPLARLQHRLTFGRERKKLSRQWRKRREPQSGSRSDGRRYAGHDGSSIKVKSN